MTARTVTFTDLMALEAIGENTFMSKHPSYNPGGGQAYGGHVYAQSVYAASHTVGEGMVVHNVHGYFTLQGRSDRPYIFTIEHLSGGRSYCTRSVTARQPLSASQTGFIDGFAKEDVEGEKGKICFTCICSFKRDEVGLTEHQVSEAERPRVRYGAVIEAKRVEEWEEMPGVDAPWWYRQSKSHPMPLSFPGLEMRKVDMSQFNKGKSPSDYRELALYRPIGTISPTAYNLHACAHLYASDRNSLYIISNAVGFGDEVGTMGSLSHSVVFHVNSKKLVLKEGEWWYQESRTPRSGDGRGVHEGKIWNPKGEVHVASSWQDGLVRKAAREEDQKQKMLWFEGMKKGGKLGGNTNPYSKAPGKYKL